MGRQERGVGDDTAPCLTQMWMLPSSSSHTCCTGHSYQPSTERRQQPSTQVTAVLVTAAAGGGNNLQAAAATNPSVQRPSLAPAGAADPAVQVGLDVFQLLPKVPALQGGEEELYYQYDGKDQHVGRGACCNWTSSSSSPKSQPCKHEWETCVTRDMEEEVCLAGCCSTSCPTALRRAST